MKHTSLLGPSPRWLSTASYTSAVNSRRVVIVLEKTHEWGKDRQVAFQTHMGIGVGHNSSASTATD